VKKVLKYLPVIQYLGRAGFDGLVRIQESFLLMDPTWATWSKDQIWLDVSVHASNGEFLFDHQVKMKD